MQRLALVLAFLGFACVCGRSVAAFDEDLHAAIREGDVEAVRSKLSKGVDLEAVCPPNFNCKPLVYAAFLGRRQIVEMLVDAGADLNGTISCSSAFQRARYHLPVTLSRRRKGYS
jgi:hypothetical protein